MRLQLTIALFLASFPALAQEEDRGNATSRVLVYSDNDNTTVTTSAVDGEAAVYEGIRVGAHALIDAVSSASVDVVTAATGRWDENRVELGGRAAVTLLNTAVRVGYTRSQENDWLSHSMNIGLSRELFERNVVVSASYGLTLNTVGRAMDPNFEDSIDAHSVEFGISQLLDEKTRIGGAYSLQVLNGYLASPYRFVVALDGTRVPETHPDSRVRHAVTGYAVRSMAEDLSLRLSYRLYRDDWGITSHTGSLRGAFAFAERFILGAETRGYLQNRADFFQGTYATGRRYMSFDRELSTFWDVGGILDLAAQFGPLTADAKIGAFYYKFDDFPALPNRTAVIAGGGAKVVW